MDHIVIHGSHRAEDRECSAGFFCAGPLTLKTVFQLTFNGFKKLLKTRLVKRASDYPVIGYKFDDRISKSLTDDDDR